MLLFNELKRRNVFRVAIAYLAGAWLLTEVAGTLFPAFGIPDWAFRLVVILFALGFVPALIFSWAYELTPEGIKRETEVVRDRSITHLTAKRLDVFTIGLIVLAIVFILTDRLWLSPRIAEQLDAPAEVATGSEETVKSDTIASQFPPNSIAVLPFVNMSDDASNEYFSDGISEDLLNLLAKIPELQVIARTSSFSYKGKDVRISDVARELNVSHVLEGSVRKVGNQVRITAQLIKSDSETHLWSETYDRELENIFAVQDEISAAVIEALKEQLGLEVEAVPRVIATANTDAHDAFLRGRYLLAQRKVMAIEGAIHEFEKAITLDPDYAPAHAELAIAVLFLRIYGDQTLSEALAKAIPHAERAMALDSTLAEAHAATGYIFRFQENAEEALTHFRRAISINPNYSLAYNAMGVLLNTYLGNYDEAFTTFQTALRLDPLLIPANSNHINGLIERRRLAEADRELEKLASISQSSYSIWNGNRLSLNGRWTNAVLGRLDALLISPESVALRNDLSRQLAILGLEEEALSVSESPLPVVYSLLGKHEDAVIAAQARLASDPIYLTARRRLGFALAAAGEYMQARPILEEMWQRSGERVTRGGPFQAPTAAALIAIHRDAGEEAAVSEVVAAIRENVHRSREAGITMTLLGGYETSLYSSLDYEEGLAAYLAGDYKMGLELITKAVEAGTFIPQSEAYLQVLYDHPAFVLIRATLEAHRTRERQKFLTTVCTNNPYSEVWQPAKQTCNLFAAESVN